MREGAFARIDETVLSAVGPPAPRTKVAIGVLALLSLAFPLVWLYQSSRGMGVTGLNVPVGWGVYIANFVFWIGIAHSGTLISAILKLTRARWRTSIARAAEAMTLIAIGVAGVWPLVHLGRVNVFYYVLPYPNQMDLWPNFTSPLVWDAFAITTYLIVSTLFFFVGMIPDAASARDRFTARLGRDHWRARLFRVLAVGWCGSGRQWHHYGRTYLYFAALAAPLVVSVHSIVSWDFAMSLQPGWHTTISAPYFVAGAIHSGLAMVLTLLIPMRRALGLESLITRRNFDGVAQVLVFTGILLLYFYVVENFIGWYSGETTERHFLVWRATSWIAPFFWIAVVVNVVPALLLLSARIRHDLRWLFGLSLLINVAMWSERYMIVVSGTAHGYLPHAWGDYAPSWVELALTASSFGAFFLLFLGFTKLLPTVAASDIKEEQLEEALPPDAAEPPGEGRLQTTRPDRPGVVFAYDRLDGLLAALERLRGSRFTAVETFTPMRVAALEERLGRGPSPVRAWTLAGALFGLTAGLALAASTARVHDLVVGGKPVVAWIPFALIGFECLILFGALANFAGLLVHGRLGRLTVPSAYRPAFGRDRYGLFVAAAPEDQPDLDALLADTRPRERHAG